MARLPDIGEVGWGAILNEFLGVSHNSDGTLLTSWQSYTPVFGAGGGSPSEGTGATKEGRWIDLGEAAIVIATLTFGTSPNFGTGNLNLSLPFTCSNSLQTGSGFVYDSSAFDSFAILCSPILSQAKTDFWITQTVTAGGVTGTAPFAFAAGDIITFNGIFSAS